MLERAGVPFETASPGTDEEAAKAELIARGCDAVTLAGRLAEAKATSVETDGLVLGADQVLERADGSMLGKPRSREELREQLRSLAGTTHQLHSAAVLAESGRPVWTSVESVNLTMRRFSEAFLDHYLEREWDAVRWNVGGYRIEGMGAQLFERIEGSHFAILGMPLLPLLAELRRREVLTS